MANTGRVACGVVAVLLTGLLFVAAGKSEVGSGISVVVLEPTASGAGSVEADYSISLGGSRVESLDALLNELAQAGGDYLAILVREDVPNSEVLTVVSLASKAGYSRYAVLVFDRSRKGMAVVPSFRWVDFSDDPSTLEKLLR